MRKKKGVGLTVLRLADASNFCGLLLCREFEFRWIELLSVKGRMDTLQC